MAKKNNVGNSGEAPAKVKIGLVGEKNEVFEMYFNYMKRYDKPLLSAQRDFLILSSRVYLQAGNNKGLQESIYNTPEIREPIIWLAKRGLPEAIRVYYDYIGKDDKSIFYETERLRTKLENYKVKEVLTKGREAIADHISYEELRALAAAKKRRDPNNRVKNTSYASLMKTARKALVEELDATKEFNKCLPDLAKPLNAMEKLDEFSVDYGYSMFYDITYLKEHDNLFSTSKEIVNKPQKDLSDGNLLNLYNAAKNIMFFNSNLVKPNIVGMANDTFKDIANLELTSLPHNLRGNFPHLETQKEKQDKFLNNMDKQGIILGSAWKENDGMGGEGK